MDAPRRLSLGLYGTLGVRIAASPREIEVAFREWGSRRVSGAADLEGYRRAEAAYHLLADPGARARHDRQLGLSQHPAWSAGKERAIATGLLRAAHLLARGRNVQARQALERIVPLAPGDPAARSYLALALARTGGDLHEAVRLARFAVERQPREPAFLFNLADVYAAAGLKARSLGARVRGWRAVCAAVLSRPSP
jgi:predicted Zn-dependent protease